MEKTEIEMGVAALKLQSITIGIGHRCPTCKELPYEFRSAFPRRVGNLYIIPAKSQHYTSGKDGKPEEYIVPPDSQSAEGLYTAVIVPQYLLGKVLIIKEEDENDRKIEEEREIASKARRKGDDKDAN